MSFLFKYVFDVSSDAFLDAFSKILSMSSSPGSVLQSN